jgi:hypothetical protein
MAHKCLNGSAANTVPATTRSNTSREPSANRSHGSTCRSRTSRRRRTYLAVSPPLPREMAVKRISKIGLSGSRHCWSGLLAMRSSEPSSKSLRKKFGRTPQSVAVGHRKHQIGERPRGAFGRRWQNILSCSAYQREDRTVLMTALHARISRAWPWLIAPGAEAFGDPSVGRPYARPRMANPGWQNVHTPTSHGTRRHPKDPGALFEPRSVRARTLLPRPRPKQMETTHQ